MSRQAKGLVSQYDDVYLVDGVRTPFADYNTVLGLVSPNDLGLKVAREVSSGHGYCRRMWTPSLQEAWLRPASMLTCFPATWDSTPAFPLRCQRIWCSGFAERALKPSFRQPTRSHLGKLILVWW